MAEQRRPRMDGYGRPLPMLVEVRQDYYGDKVANKAQRERLYALLEEQWQVLLRQGMYGELVIHAHIMDGILQDQTAVSVTRQIRLRKDDGT